MYMWREPWRTSLTKIFEEANKEFGEAEHMLNRLFRTADESSPSDIAKFPYYYGYQITVGPDGKPHIREFGNVRSSARGLAEQETVSEPLVDTTLDEKENMLKIVVEMPGVAKENIEVNVMNDYVSIHAENGDKRYHTDLPVSVKLDDKTAKATYINGILELKIKLKEPVKPEGTPVQVE
ncbi:MAG: archaeal heat shock protein Hsp20 [Nitrososphaerales archaeon]